MNSIQTLLGRYLWIMRERKLVLLGLLCAFCFSGLLDVLGIGAIAVFMRLLLDAPSVIDSPIGTSLGWLLQSEGQFITFFAVLGFTFFAGKTVVGYATGLYVSYFHLRKRTDLQIKIFDAYLHAPHSYRMKRNLAELIFVATFLTNGFINQFSLSLFGVVGSLIPIVIIGTFLAFTNWIVTIIVIVLFGGFALLYFLKIKNRVGIYGRELGSANHLYLKVFREGLSSMNEINIYGCEDHFTGIARRQTGEMKRLDFRMNVLKSLPRPSAEVLLIGFIVFFTLIYYWTMGDVTEVSTTLGIFGLAGLRMVPAISQIVASLSGVKGSSYMVHRLFDEMKDLERMEASSRAFQETRQAGVKRDRDAFREAREYTLESIRFHYENDEDVLRGINVRIAHGEIVALVGRSGSGKTTLMNLFLGYLQPTEGDIRADGVSIYSNPSAWRSVISYLPQSIYILDDTIARNVAFGLSDDLIDEERVRWALRTASMMEFVDTLPKGIHTLLGDQGSRLSGGQRQRIGIARALYYKRRILVMDEATSALDEETERQVKESILALRGHVTVIMITHHLYDPNNFDQVLRIEEGCIRPIVSAGEGGRA